jgi:hypothetical protein
MLSTTVWHTATHCTDCAGRRDKYEGKKLRCKLKLVATSQATSAQPTAAQRTLSNGKTGGRWTVGGSGHTDVAATWTAARNSSAQYKQSNQAVLREEDKTREVHTIRHTAYTNCCM